MKKQLLRTTAVSVALVAVFTADSSHAASYLPDSPYAAQRAEQRLARYNAPASAADASPTDSGPTDAVSADASPTNAGPTDAVSADSVNTLQMQLAALPVAQSSPDSAVIVPPPPQILALPDLPKTAPLIPAVSPRRISAVPAPGPLKPLYPSRVNDTASSTPPYRPDQIEMMMDESWLEAPAPTAPPPDQLAQLAAPLPPLSTPSSATIAPRILPLPTGDAPTKEVPRFKPFATLETSKEVPLSPAIHQVPKAHVASAPPTFAPEPERTGAAVTTVADPEPPMQKVPIQKPAQTAPALLPVPPAEPDARKPRNANAPSAIVPAAKQQAAAALSSPEQPTAKSEPSLSKETRAILSTLPSGVDSPRKQNMSSADISRFDPEIQGILNAAEGSDGEEMQSHESLGVSIQVRRPSININTELQKAYDSLINGYPDIAVDIYKDILRAAPRNQDALFGLATTFHRIGEYTLARPFYGKLLAINPKHRDGLNNFMALVAEESPQDAIAQLKNLERSNPDFSAIPAQLAIIYDKQGSHDQAVNSLLRAIKLSPENLAYKYNLAVLYDGHGDYDSATVLYRQLLAASRSGLSLPTDPDALQRRMIYINNQQHRG